MTNNNTYNENNIENPAEVDLTSFKELPNTKDSEGEDHDKGRQLIVKDSTFVLDNGTYKGIITDAFWYKTKEDKDRVMLIFELEDGIEFKNSVDGDWIDRYPFSRLISQANINYVEDFEGLSVKFKIKNTEGDTVTFSNIKKISLDE